MPAFGEHDPDDHRRCLIGKAMRVSMESFTQGNAPLFLDGLLLLGVACLSYSSCVS
jgi:hypothetical protein